MGVNSFQVAYLKEIGVQTPISSFVGEHKTEAVTAAENFELQTYVAPQVDEPAMVAEPEVIPDQDVVASVQKEAKPTQIVSPLTTDGLAGLKIKAEACKACELVESRNQLVFGDGNVQADLVFIAEAPGRDEDLAGKPGMGASGVLFDSMLASIGLSREQIYLMHGVKCRPQHNRDPKPLEFASCEFFLSAQLDQIQPKVICMLGRVVAQALLKTDVSLTELREGRFSYRGVPVLVIDHPSYLLRTQQHKRRAWKDLCRLASFLHTLN